VEEVDATVAEEADAVVVEVRIDITNETVAK
jgi:hypothetical protein